MGRRQGGGAKMMVSEISGIELNVTKRHHHPVAVIDQPRRAHQR